MARFSQSAAASRAAIISRMKVSAFWTTSGETMPEAMVLTTSPPASMAPAVSKMAAMSSALPRVSALEPTAGPMLLATSLAPMLSAM